jgi:hypothetical protein
VSSPPFFEVYGSEELSPSSGNLSAAGEGDQTTSRSSSKDKSYYRKQADRTGFGARPLFAVQ